MTIRSPRIKTFAESSFRLTVGLSAGLLVLWIAVVGLNAIVANPYTIVAVWLLGLFGLFACTGACINTFHAPGRDEEIPHPGRALFCLTGGLAVGWVLWAQARPAMQGEPLGMEVVGLVLAGAVILGLVLIMLLSLVLLTTQEGRA